MATINHQWLCAQIVDNNPQDAVIFAGTDGLIQVWNKGAEKIFGHSAEEAIGQSLDLIIPERLRDRHWTGYDEVIKTGVTKYGAELLAVPAIRKDGTRISIEFSIALVKDSSGNLLGPGVIMRDVTEKWSAERAAQQRIAALETKVKELGGTP